MAKNAIANERKNQIVRATVDCITSFGYHNFSMQDVAKKAGVSKGIIHYYFLNKDDLMMSVLDKVAGDIQTTLKEKMGQAKLVYDKMEIFIEVTINVVRNSKEYYQVNMDFWTQINQKEDVRSVIASHYEKFRESCAEVLKEGIANGEFADIPVEETAAAIVGMLDGLSLQWLFDENRFKINEILDQSKKMIFSFIEKK